MKTVDFCRFGKNGGIIFVEVNRLLSENVRYARIHCGYTQQQLADFLGVERSLYSRYETGHTPFPIAILPGLCAAFGVSADWLLHTNIRLESGESELVSWEESRLPGLAKLTKEERDLLLLLRKHKLTEKVTEYAMSLTEESQSE